MSGRLSIERNNSTRHQSSRHLEYCAIKTNLLNYVNDSDRTNIPTRISFYSYFFKFFGSLPQIAQESNHIRAICVHNKVAFHKIVSQVIIIFLKSIAIHMNLERQDYLLYHKTLNSEHQIPDSFIRIHQRSLIYSFKRSNMTKRSM